MSADPPKMQTVTPYLLIQDAPAQIEFLKRALGAEEMFRVPRGDGSIMHAEVRIGESVVMMSEPRGNFTLMPAMNYVHVKDADATFRKALNAGASIVMEMADQFWGARGGGVRDLHGNIWFIATHKENVPLDEINRRAADLTPRQ